MSTSEACIDTSFKEEATNASTTTFTDTTAFTDVTFKEVIFKEDTNAVVNLKKVKRPVSPTQFKIFRLIFGVYLIWHFSSLLGYGPELFSDSGMIPDPLMNPTWATWVHYVPTFLIPSSPEGITGLLNIMIVSSLFFALGMSQMLNSLILWYGWAFLFNRNNFISNPGLPYVGWLLLACSIIANPGSLFSMFPVFSLDQLRQLKDINDIRSWTYSGSRSCSDEKGDESGAKTSRKNRSKTMKGRDKILKTSRSSKNENEDEDLDIDDKVVHSENPHTRKLLTPEQQDEYNESGTETYKKEKDEGIKDAETDTYKKEEDKDWHLPPLIFWGAWFLMAIGYTVSGVHKLQCASWRDGSALLHVLESLLARDNSLVTMTINFMIKYPLFMKLSTWASLFLEISFLPLGIFDRLRLPYWVSFMVMHLGILSLIDFTDLTLGVLMIHLFTFDGRWLSHVL